jgi:hypothetical protein
MGELLYPLTNADNTGIRKRLTGKSFFLNKRELGVEDGEGKSGHIQLDLFRGNDLVKGERYE